MNRTPDPDVTLTHKEAVELVDFLATLHDGFLDLFSVLDNAQMDAATGRPMYVVIEILGGPF